MAQCNTTTLMADAKCFTCLPPGMWFPIKLALLARWLKQLDPDADTSPQGLMRSASCFICLPPGMFGPLKLALLCRILGGGSGCTTPPIPGNFTFGGNAPGVAEFTWTEASNPSSGFTISFGQINGGPYTEGSASFGGSIRDGVVNGPFIPGDTWYFVIQASNGVGCVSGLSSQIRVDF